MPTNNKYWLLWTTDTIFETQSIETISWSTVTKFNSSSILITGSTGNFNKNIWYNVQDLEVTYSQSDSNSYEMYAYMTTDPSVFNSLNILPVFGNQYQVAYCPDGVTSSSVEANTYFESTQAIADTIAFNHAESMLICSSPTSSLFDYCGVTQHWPSMSQNIPYINSGNNITGWVQVAGYRTFVSNHLFNVGADLIPFNCFGTISDVISTIPLNGGSPGSTDNGQTYFSLPAIVTGDFIFTVDIQQVVHLSAGIAIAFADSNQRQAVLALTSNDPTSLSVSSVCNIQGYTDELANIFQVSNGSSTVNTNDGNWHTFKFQRVGTLYSFYIDTEFVCSLDPGDATGGQIGFGWAGDSTWNFRNFSVTAL